MADDDNTPQTDDNKQGIGDTGTGTPDPKKAAEASSIPPTDAGGDTDPLAPKAGETVEQYAARVRGEVGWRDKQLSRTYRQKKEAEDRAAKAADLEAENARLKELAEAGAKKGKQAAEPEPEPRRIPAAPPVDRTAIENETRLKVGLERLAEGLQKHKDYRGVIQNFERVGGMDQAVMAAILDTDDPEHVFMTLGRNMDQYQEVLDLPDGRRRARLIKIGLEKTGEPAPKPAAKPKVSNAPAPVGGMAPGTAEGQEGDVDIYDPQLDWKHGQDDQNLSHDQLWYAKRLEQKRNSTGRPWSFGGKSGPGPRAR